MKMRCKSAIKQIGPFIDGELSESEKRALQEHLDTCEDCAGRCALMRGLLKELSSLPAVVPTPAESYRLTNRLRRELAEPAAPRPVFRRGQLAAAALSALVLITVVGVSVAVWSGGGPAPVVEEVPAQEGITEIDREAVQPSDDLSSEPAGEAGLAAAALSRPSLVASGNEYTAAELEGFRNDLGTRLDFYSTYWYPTSSGTLQPASLKRRITQSRNRSNRTVPRTT